MIEHYQAIVKQNQSNLSYFQKRSRRTEFDHKINASYDVAVSRMNTVLLKLIQYPISALELESRVDTCQNTLNKFYHYTKKYDESKWFKWYYRMCLHGIGEKQFHHIRSLLNTVEAKISE
jgi:hypothetical protein